jgi:hypothetical protein
VPKTRRIPEAAAIKIRDLVVAELDSRYGPKNDKGARPVGQRQICDDLDVSQPVLQDIENGTGSLGVHALVAVRNFLRKYTIDDLLGLDPLPAPKPAPAPPNLSEMQRMVRETVLAALDERQQPPPPSDPAPVVPKKGSPDAPRPRRR